MRVLPMDGPRVLRAVAVAAALTGVGALAGCSSAATPGAAAVDADGDVIVTVSEVEDLVQELTPLSSSGAEGLGSQVVYLAIVADDVRELAQTNGLVVSTDTVKQSLGEQGIEVGDTAADLVAVSDMYNQLAQTEAGALGLQESLEALEVTVNPRYGEFIASPETGYGMAEISLPWVADSTAEEVLG